MVDAALLSDRRVSAFNDAERLVLWALRHRVATGDPTSPHLSHAFSVLGGASTGPRAHAALDRLVVALETHARRPLAFFEWCNRAVTTDEAQLLATCAALQDGWPTCAGLGRLVSAEGLAATRAAMSELVAHPGDVGLPAGARRGESGLWSS